MLCHGKNQQQMFSGDWINFFHSMSRNFGNDCWTLKWVGKLFVSTGCWSIEIHHLMVGERGIHTICVLFVWVLWKWLSIVCRVVIMWMKYGKKSYCHWYQYILKWCIHGSGTRSTMVYDQQDVADALATVHGLMQKTIIPLNPQTKTDKLEIWQLVSGIRIWYIWNKGVWR